MTTKNKRLRKHIAIQEDVIVAIKLRAEAEERSFSFMVDQILVEELLKHSEIDR